MPTAWRVFLVFFLAYFLSYFFRSANAVLAPDLSRDLALGPAQLGLMTSLFYLSFALVQIPLGPLLDRYGPRAVTPGLMLVGFAGSLIFGNAQSFAVLALGRVLLGIGFAGVLMGAMKAFSLWFPDTRYATASSLLVALGSTGALVAATPLAVLKETAGWRGVFEWGSLVILGVALGVMLLGRNHPPGVSWPKGNSSAGFAEVWRNPQLLRIAFLGFSITGGLLAFQTLWGGAFLYAQGMGALEVGNLLFLFSLSASVGFLVMGVLADRLGIARVTAAASLFFAGGLLTLAFFGGVLPDSAFYLIYPLLGFCGGANILTLAHARLIFPPELTGRATTTVNLFGIGGTFVLQWWMGVLVGASGYLAAWGFVGLLLLVALWAYRPLLGASQHTINSKAQL
ncbi:MAG TPA: MFS transporter [Meiothermus sp.]|nr:MFS transporter [Meiothermus sp.]